MYSEYRSSGTYRKIKVEIFRHIQTCSEYRSSGTFRKNKVKIFRRIQYIHHKLIKFLDKGIFSDTNVILREEYCEESKYILFILQY